MGKVDFLGLFADRSCDRILSAEKKFLRPEWSST
jgi:hypothetical protein